jgi:arsenite methyltransferase
VGFADLRFTNATPFGIDDCAVMPLFTPELIELMRRLIPAERQDCVATAVIVQARKP